MAQGKSEPSTAAPDVLQVQHQIRANASELQDYFADLYKWEKAIGQQEEASRKEAPPLRVAVPLPRGRKAVAVSSTSAPSPAQNAETVASKTESRADAHTYDKGYKKWEKFDADAALRDDDDGQSPSVKPQADKLTGSKPVPKAIKKVVTTSAKSAPTANASPAKSREDIEREDGNDHYKRGDYNAAIKSYTRALGFNSRNVVVLSNRAMAYLKNKEYSKAEDDCSLALKMDDTHVKSYSRRATARNALGKHRLALLDFERALELDPKSKQIASQVAAMKELMRTAIKRAPKKTQFNIKVVGDVARKPEAGKSTAPKVEGPEDKENAPRVANQKIMVIEETARIAQSSTEALEQLAQPATDPAPPLSAVPPASVRKAASAPLPKLPKKAAASSYEFLRVWKTFAPKGDEARAKQLLDLRASYLRMLEPASLSSVFKNSIESELCCEIFATIRQAMDVVGADKEFVTDLVRELPRVPRFSMVVMFLSDKEKADIAWSLDAIIKSEEQGSDLATQLQALRPQYGLK